MKHIFLTFCLSVTVFGFSQVNDQNGNQALGTNGDPLLGNIGIGTTTPTAKTEIVNSNPNLDHFRISSSTDVGLSGDIFKIDANGDGFLTKGLSVYSNNAQAALTVGLKDSKSLYFEMERPWYFGSADTGGGNKLTLQPTSGNKKFQIRNENGKELFEFRTANNTSGLDKAAFSVLGDGKLGIGISADDIYSSAKLQINSTSKGFLPPRITDVNTAISSPVEGLLAYQTDGDAGMYQYNGTDWQKLATGTSSSGVGKFVDGADPNDAVYVDGNVGIGTKKPNAKLDVFANSGVVQKMFRVYDTNTAEDIFTIDQGRFGNFRRDVRIGLGNDQFNISTGTATFEHGGVDIWRKGGANRYFSQDNIYTSYQGHGSQMFIRDGKFAFNKGISAASAFVEYVNTTSNLDYFHISSSIGGEGDVLTINSDGKLGIGTTNFNQPQVTTDTKLVVNGKALFEEVKVIADVTPDYVFQKYYTGTSKLKANYQMPTLEEVEAYTKANHHLPEVPSATKMKEEGMQLKEMTTILLQKIEELTLYTIEQEKKLKAQKAKNKSLEERLEKLEKSLNK